MSRAYHPVHHQQEETRGKAYFHKTEVEYRYLERERKVTGSRASQQVLEQLRHLPRGRTRPHPNQTIRQGYPEISEP